MSDDTPIEPAAGGPQEADGKEALPALADVLDYLKDGGWKETRTSLYRRAKEGKLLPGAGGAYALKDVDKYARTFLKRQSSGKKVSEEVDGLQRQKLEKEMRILDLDIRSRERKEAKDAGNLIPREEMEIALATWAGIVDAGLTHWIKSQAAGWVRLVGGEMAKVGELVTQMIREKDDHINSYTTAEFNVILEGDKGEEIAEEEVAEEEEPC